MFRQGLASLFDSEPELELLGQASNGREAWELIETLKPDVAILDINMRELTGIDVVHKLVDAGLSTQILLLTMHEDPFAAREAQEAGANGYILTYNTFQDLVIAVRTVFAGGTFVTSTIREELRKLQRHGRACIQLSKREREVIKLVAFGKSSKEIGRIMGISPRTVDTYRKRLMEKLGLHCLADVVRYAVRVGMAS